MARTTKRFSMQAMMKEQQGHPPGARRPENRGVRKTTIGAKKRPIEEEARARGITVKQLLEALEARKKQMLERRRQTVQEKANAGKKSGK